MRFYILPIESIENGRGPKYFRWSKNPHGLPAEWQMMDYGLNPVALLASALSPEQHSSLMSHGDVFALPSDINQPLGKDLRRISSALESFGIPVWCHANDSIRTLVRMTCGVFQFAQHYHGLFVEPLLQDVRPTWGAMTGLARQKWLWAAERWGVGIIRLSGATPVRDILRTLSTAWCGSRILAGGFAL